MGVEFFEEGPNRTLSTLSQRQAGSITRMVLRTGMTQSISGAQVVLVVVGLLALFVGFLLYTVQRDFGGSAPTSAEVENMRALLKKR